MNLVNFVCNLLAFSLVVGVFFWLVFGGFSVQFLFILIDVGLPWVLLFYFFRFLLKYIMVDILCDFFVFLADFGVA